jgi:hypothetical protein
MHGRRWRLTDLHSLLLQARDTIVPRWALGNMQASPRHRGAAETPTQMMNRRRSRDQEAEIARPGRPNVCIPTGLRSSHSSELRELDGVRRCKVCWQCLSSAVQDIITCTHAKCFATAQTEDARLGVELLVGEKRRCPLRIEF